jgi:hypothetical protein
VLNKVLGKIINNPLFVNKTRRGQTSSTKVQKRG